jgi:hypothetical protein
MSVLDRLRGLEQEVQQRLRELGPLVAEYRDLEKVAERLGLRREESEPTETRAAKPAPRAAGRAKPSRARARKPAATKAAAAKRAASAQAPTPGPKPKPAAAARGGKPSARRRGAAAPGQRQQDVLRLVRERPGITVAELAGALGVDATGLYGVVRRLQSTGQIRKDGTGLRPVEETTPTTAAAAKPAAEAGSASSTATAQPRPEGAETPATE